MKKFFPLLIFIFVAFTTPCIIEKCKLDKVGLFFGWELGAIIQSIFSFWSFAQQDTIPHISNRKKNWLNGFILLALFFFLLIYLISKVLLLNEFLIEELPHIGVIIKFFVSDAITLLPMLLFFLTNVILFVYIKKRMHLPDNEAEAYVDMLKETIIYIDCSCLVPYLLIIVFSFLYRRSFDWETYISGAGALLLLTSNLLTDSIGDRLKRKKFKLYIF